LINLLLSCDHNIEITTSQERQC